ncbi:DUF6443 domain-containing protein [Reichenbachiella sp.]|uniref:DUF6443 domain-containing protein n=1 Tax=Reichenbachiella sp. TaxID=2184521 RepID=UPI003BB0A738
MKNLNIHLNKKVIASSLLFLVVSLIFTHMAFSQIEGKAPIQGAVNQASAVDVGDDDNGGGGSPPNLTPPMPPSGFVINGTGCGTVNILAPESEPSDTEWFIMTLAQKTAGIEGAAFSGRNATVTTRLASSDIFYIFARRSLYWSEGRILSSSGGHITVHSQEPNRYDLKDPETQCAGSAVTFEMGASQTGVTYHLKKGTTTVSTKSGTGGSISFGAVSAVGTYSVTAVHNTSKCSRQMNNTWTLHGKPSPPSYTLSSNNCGNKTITPGTPPQGTVWAKSNFTYRSVPDQAPDKDNLEGPTGGYYTYTAFDAVEDIAVSKTMNFRAMNRVTGCLSTLESESITIKPYPAEYELKEPSVTCGGQPIQFKLSGSQTDATYHLQKNGSTVTSKTGSGSAITFSDVTSSGNYTAIAIHNNGCQTPMRETRLIDGLPDPPSYSISLNECGDKTFVKEGNPPLGITWAKSRFVLVNVEDGPPDKDNLETHTSDYYRFAEFEEDVNVSVSRTIELQSLNLVTGCLSSVLTVPVEVTHMPNVLNTIDNFTFCAVEVNSGAFEMSGMENDVTYTIEGNRVAEHLGMGLVKWTNVPEGRYTVHGQRGACGRNLNAIIHFGPTDMPTINSTTLEVFEETVLDLAVVSGSDKGTWSGPGVSGKNMVAARAGLGTHQIGIYYDNEGCVLDDELEVNVHPIPTLKLDNSSVVRPGTNVGMSIENYSQDYTYGWYKGSATIDGSLVTANQAGLYVLKATTSSNYSALSNTIYLTAPKAQFALNYVASSTYKIPEKVEASLPTAYSEISKGFQYIDGLGQVNQVVQKNASHHASDLVFGGQLDEYGRAVKQYLPVPTGNDGTYKSHFGEDQLAYYTTQYGASEGQTAYAETDYENSPLSRPVKTFSPGFAWNKGQGHRPVEINYAFNATGEVINWTLENGQPKKNATYSPGKLHKTTTKDENGRRVQEFKNLDGQVVLKKVQASEADPSSENDWFQTYYIYDDLGNLRTVIPPRATQLINN